MSFSEVKLFQVKPGNQEKFEQLVADMRPEQILRPGCKAIRYVKRFYVFDRLDEEPRPLTKIVKCVKYYSYWEFDTIKQYADATEWFFSEFGKKIMPLLIMPFDINCGEAVE